MTNLCPTFPCRAHLLVRMVIIACLAAATSAALAEAAQWADETACPPTETDLTHALGMYLAPDFSASPTEGVVPLEVHFRDESEGQIDSWVWAFGDGDTSTARNPSHTYATPNVYSVDMSVASSRGATAEHKNAYVWVGFPDLPPAHWSFQQVLLCTAEGIVSGYPDGQYHGDWPVTRDQMAVYTSRALAGGDENVPDFSGTPTFAQLAAGLWALDHIEYAVENNIIQGYSDGMYWPEERVTRGQMAVYVARALVAPAGEEGLTEYVPADPRNFPDVGSDFCAYKHIEYCVEHGVVQGYLDGCYHPEHVVTRDQMAVYVARAFELAP